MVRWCVVGLLLLVGCAEKKKQAPPPAPSPPKVEKTPLTKDWLGPKPAIPAGLPALGDPHIEGEREATVERVTYSTEGNAGRVTAVIVHLEPDGVAKEAMEAVEALPTFAWGEGEESMRRLRTDVATRLWFDPDRGLRATAYYDNNGYAVLRFEKYLPVAKLLGPGLEIGAFDKDVFGKTLAELKTLYPHYATESGIDLPEVEYGPISLVLEPRDGPITSVRFRLPLNRREKGVDPTSAVVDKWGRFKRKVDPMHSEEVVLREKAPYVAVIPADRDRSLGTSLQVHVADPPPKE